MKRIGLLAFSITCVLMISACSVQSDAASLYKQEAPLQVEVNLPDSLSANEEVVLEAVLKQDGKSIDEANFVHFEIWKQDGSVHFPMEEAVAAGGGVYQMNIRFENEGLYYLQVHAGNKGSLISPQHQFIVGDLSDDELESLKQGPKNEAVPNHHH